MYIMSYSKDETQSLYIAVSEDMYHWESLNEGSPVLDLRPEGKIIRDPYWFVDINKTYHVLFTDNWSSTTIGHAVSQDLLHWSTPNYIAVMGDNEDVANCWAPEMFIDEQTKDFVLIWSSSFYSKNNENKISNRIYSCRTKDFKQFTSPKLFFDPGYTVIDATILVKNDTYYMAFKDERGHNSPDSPYAAIRTAVSKQADGPYTEISPLLTPWRSEGPILVEKDSCFYLFYDCFGEYNYKGIKSSDFKNWTDISMLMDFPKDCKHLCICEIDHI